MNPIIKRIGIIFAVIGVLAISIMLGLVFIFLYLFFSSDNIEKTNKDYASQTIICDSTQIIERSPMVSFYNSKFEPRINIEFKLIRKNQIVESKTLLQQSGSCYIPFDNFYKTDSILIVVDDNLCYFSYDFSLKPYLGYGMFGYVGFHECRTSENFTINGKEQTYSLEKDKGIPIDSIPQNFR